MKQFILLSFLIQNTYLYYLKPHLFLNNRKTNETVEKPGGHKFVYFWES